MITIIGIKNCNSMKKTFDLLDEKGVEYEFRNVKSKPLISNELKDLASKVGLEILINKKGMMWRKL
jgi:arsenate reductase-like glutaredoxin family protein